MGRPMLWRNGHGIVLDHRRGSAHGIADDGTIGGQVGRNALIADAGRPHAAIHLLDGQLAGDRWHVTAAYASGRVDKSSLPQTRAREHRRSSFLTQNADR